MTRKPEALAPITIHLKDLFFNEQLGPVRYGMTAEEVEALLGQPHYHFENESKDILIVLYGSYEIRFANFLDENTSDYTVYGFANVSLRYETDLEFNQSHITLDPWIFKHGLTLNEAMGLLNELGITYGYRLNYEVHELLFETGASISFYHYEEDDLDISPMLYRIGAENMSIF